MCRVVLGWDENEKASPLNSSLDHSLDVGLDLEGVGSFWPSIVPEEV